MSVLQRMMTFWRANGMLYDGNRDLYKTYGWTANPTHQQFVAKYREQDIARRIINAPVSGLWSDPPVISGDESFTSAWKDFLLSHPVFSIIQRLDKLAGLGRFAILVVGFDDNQKLEQPVKLSQGRKVTYLQPYAEGSVSIKQYDTNANSERFGLPLTYTVSPGKFDDLQGSMSIAQSPQTSTFDVHWTRVVHIAENLLESNVFGQSRLRCVYNVLDDILKVSGGSAETYWLTANRGLHIDVDKDMDLSESAAEDLNDEVDEYEHNLRRVIRTRGVKVSPLGSDIADPQGIFAMQLSLISAATGIPQRILAGSEAGQLASQQDRASWAQVLSERISEYGEPVILLPLVRTLINAGVLPIPSTFKIDWPDAFKMNPLERAQTSAQMARSASNLAKALQTIDNINLTALPTTTILPASSGAPTEQKVELRTPINLLTPEECRSIIGFGKHAPVFDNRASDIPSAVR
ncbi:MAG: DUF1073 domain-containing protein [Desulfurellales bacterium]|nr:MAG: DUF1073 domain-containing protein [Desulfurellales bacterium]